MLRSWLVRRMVTRNLVALNQGDVGPMLRMESPGVHFRFPGSSSWAIDAVGRDQVEAWLRRMTATGLQHRAEDVVAVGPPWRMTLILRGTDRCDGPGGVTVYDNRYVIWATAKWGRITDYEVYEDTEKLTAFDSYLAQTAAASGT